MTNRFVLGLHHSLLASALVIFYSCTELAPARIA